LGELENLIVLVGVDESDVAPCSHDVRGNHASSEQNRLSVSEDGRKKLPACPEGGGNPSTTHPGPTLCAIC